MEGAVSKEHNNDEDWVRRCAQAPGREWRVLAHEGSEAIAVKNRGVFDEVVVDHWLHVEQMDEREWWIRVGDVRISTRIHANGSVEVDVERGVYGPAVGTTRTDS